MKSFKVELSRVLDEVLDDTPDLAKSHPDHFPFIWKALQRHPHAATRLAHVERVVLAMSDTGNFPRRTAFLVLPDGTVEDISLRNKCVTGKETGAGDPRYELKLAMRSAVANDIAAFRDAHLHDGCALCGQTGLGAEHMHVDHVTPFRDLTEAFFRDAPVPPANFECNDTFMTRRGFREADAAYAEAWVAFHREAAHLRMLCLACNCAWRLSEEEAIVKAPMRSFAAASASNKASREASSGAPGKAPLFSDL
jgi:hypothetical protein